MSAKGTKLTPAQKEAQRAGRLKAKLERTKARADFMDRMTELAKVAAPGAAGIVTATVAAGFCTTPYRSAVFLALPFAPMRLFSVPGLGIGGAILHQELVDYLADVIVTLTDRGVDEKLHPAQKLFIGGMAGVFAVLSIEFIRQLGGIARGIGEAVPG